MLRQVPLLFSIHFLLLFLLICFLLLHSAAMQLRTRVKNRSIDWICGVTSSSESILNCWQLAICTRSSNITYSPNFLSKFRFCHWDSLFGFYRRRLEAHSPFDYHRCFLFFSLNFYSIWNGLIPIGEVIIGYQLDAHMDELNCGYSRRPTVQNRGGDALWVLRRSIWIIEGHSIQKDIGQLLACNQKKVKFPFFLLWQLILMEELFILNCHLFHPQSKCTTYFTIYSVSLNWIPDNDLPPLHQMHLNRMANANIWIQHREEERRCRKIVATKH